MRKDIVSFADFQKLDLRVGRVVKVEKVEGSKNLVRMSIDLGDDYGIRKIIGGIAQFYKPAQLRGKKFIIVANLAPKQMLKEMSYGMILCADAGGKPVLIPVDKKVPEGTVIR